MYERSSHTMSPARNVACRVYNTIDDHLRVYAEDIASQKKHLREDRTRLAHPAVTATTLDEFLKVLGAESQDMDVLAVQFFTHLKWTSITPENVAAAARAFG